MLSCASMTTPTFGRYEVVRPIARGGMAEVFLAVLLGEGGFARPVAIKRILPHLAAQPGFEEMLLDEARLVACIQSPYVVSTVDLGRTEDGSPFIVMDYVDGLTLRQILARSTQLLPLDHVVRVLEHVAQGLHEAHEARDMVGRPMEIVHRDISPQNIIVGVDGRARVLDFGIARALHRLSDTRTGEMKGKLSYFSPEQAEGLAVDRRADVFGWGVVAWEALTGRQLFPATDMVAIVEKLLYAPIVSPDRHNPHLSAALTAVVMRALERDPAMRYQTARELVLAWRDASRDLHLVDEEALGGFVRTLREGPVVGDEGEPPTDVDVVAPRSAPARGVLRRISEWWREDS